MLARLIFDNKTISVAGLCFFLIAHFDLGFCFCQITEPQNLSSITRMLGSHCVDCHQGDEPEGGLDISQLLGETSPLEQVEHWTRIHDRISSGEMPPKDSASLLEPERQELVQQLSTWIIESQSEHDRNFGRVPARRLTNIQLERTLQDLLKIDVPLERLMTPEPQTNHYNTLARAQSMSHYYMEQQAMVVDAALDEAFHRLLHPEPLMRADWKANEITRTRSRCREPEYIDEAAVIWSSRLIFYGRIPTTTAEKSGWYRFRFSVSAINKPRDHGVWCTVRSGRCVSSAPLLDWIGCFEAQEEPKEVTLEAWLPKGDMLEIRPYDITLKLAKFAGGQAADGEGGGQNVPGIRIHNLSVEQFHRGADHQAIRQSLLSDLDWQFDQSESQLKKLVHENASQLIRGFAERAFRRPVSVEVVRQFESIFNDRFGVTGDAIAALRAAYRAILCSPRFIYFYEQPDRHDDHAVAARLSYLLWNSMPDAELRAAADAGKLSDSEELRRQLKRMLAEPRGKQFLIDFAAQWLELNQIDFTEPDEKLYPKFDILVQQAMLGETHSFLQWMLENNLPIETLIKSDTTFLNSRLSRFYGLDEQLAEPLDDQMQMVKLSDKSHRGGLLAHGSILKVTANGTATSPVLRGVWLCQRVLGIPIPPPPESVPAIEPDIRGATTIREQLELHRNNESCASCHRFIDPPGFALENFDPAGAWRENYPRSEKLGTKGKIDASYETAEGTHFDGFESFRDLAAQHPRRLAVNFVSHLLTYGTGVEIRFADREKVESIVEAAQTNGEFGFASLVEQSILSSLFLTK